MTYASLITLVLLIGAVVAASGCIGTDTPETLIPTATPTGNPLVGDPAVGTWTGTDNWTETASADSENTKITVQYTILISENGTGNVAFDRKETKGFSVRKNTYSMDGKVTKDGSIYTIEAQVLGTYTVTLADDGTAALTVPGRQTTVPLTKNTT